MMSPINSERTRTAKTRSPINPDMGKSERGRTRRATLLAIRKGVLVRPDVCEHCHKSYPGNRYPRIEAHHPDYSEPLNVMWLCTHCHWQEHGRIAAAAYPERTLAREYAWDRREATYENRSRTAAAYWASRANQSDKPSPVRNYAKPGSKQVAAEMAASGASLTQIAEAIGLTLSGACRFMQRNGIVGQWAARTCVEITADALRRMSEAGLPQHQIAAHYGVSTPTICKLMQQHGLPSARRLAAMKRAA